ncbi:c-type cytochrome [Herminiimonas contaminans]|uniref:Cytochrome c n=1 Tax=Herminiimonas contaminans TaxID=1111140 RepID=A0ABS0EW19_9BURK|nr:cytochrome c [Herminiimonas contaminans]MBF8179025.1 cytochrome c [Herminiimonas contaminans]
MRAPAFFRSVFISVLLLSAHLLPAHAQDARLQLRVGSQQQTLALTDLLKHPAIRTIKIPADVSYKRAMEYRALPLLAILRDISKIDTLQFKASDGFVANIPVSSFLGESEAWLAIEVPQAPWPALKAGGPSAGPFYLVWLAPEKSQITQEQWPYQIASISDVTPLHSRYPQIKPHTAADSAAYRGMQIYATQCASCHQVNGGGDAAVGPDLNRPANPTEYFNEAYLRKYLRDPAAVRSWPGMTMPGFADSVMSESQMDDLLAYLRQMALQK